MTYFSMPARPQVVKHLVKPATVGHGRCRFADLPDVKPFTGPATVFMSHCWGGRWGDLVAAACSGARADRVVWIDVVAVSAGEHEDGGDSVRGST